VLTLKQADLQKEEEHSLSLSYYQRLAAMGILYR